MHRKRMFNLSAVHPAASRCRFWQDGQSDCSSVQREVESHGRLAACCVGLRHSQVLQRLAAWLAAFASSQKQ
jgi:hypothetical protein